MTLKEFIAELIDIAAEEGNGLNIEVVALTETGKEYTPIIAVGPGADGIRKITVA